MSVLPLSKFQLLTNFCILMGRVVFKMLIVLIPHNMVVSLQTLYNSIRKLKKKEQKSQPFFFSTSLYFKMTTLPQLPGYFSSILLYLCSRSKLHIWLLFPHLLWWRHSTKILAFSCSPRIFISCSGWVNFFSPLKIPNACQVISECFYFGKKCFGYSQVVNSSLPQHFKLLRSQCHFMEDKT